MCFRVPRYNLELARGVLLNATSLTIATRRGWRSIFHAVKLARLMYRVERAGKPGRRGGGSTIARWAKSPMLSRDGYTSSRQTETCGMWVVLDLQSQLT
jgi:hypothetical protein